MGRAPSEELDILALEDDKAKSGLTVNAIENEVVGIIIDSGSAATVCPRMFASHFPTKAGRKEILRSALGENIGNDGRRVVKYKHEDGHNLMTDLSPVKS